MLKDAQASIYGVKGANGVVFITSKKGKKGSAPKVFYNAYSGVQETSKKLNYMNGLEYASYLNEAYAVMIAMAIACKPVTKLFLHTQEF